MSAIWSGRQNGEWRPIAEPEIKPITGWRLVGAYVAVVFASWALLAAIAYGAWRIVEGF